MFSKTLSIYKASSGPRSWERPQLPGIPFPHPPKWPEFSVGPSVGRSFSRPPGFVPPLLSPQLNHLTDGAITSIVWNGGSEESSVGRNGGTLSLSKQELKFPMLAFFESVNFELTHLNK